LDREFNLNILVEDLQKVEEAIGTISNLTKDMKDDLIRMMSNVYDTYSQIIDILTPVYNIKDENDFNNNYSNFLQGFRNKYVDESTGQIDYYKITDLRISCGKVNHSLQRVCENKNIRNSDKLKELDLKKPLWFQDDNQANLDLYKFFERLNEELNSIKTFTELQSFISNSKFYFELLKKKLDLYMRKKTDIDEFIKDSLFKNKSNVNSPKDSMLKRFFKKLKF